MVVLGKFYPLIKNIHFYMLIGLRFSTFLALPFICVTNQCYALEIPDTLIKFTTTTTTTVAERFLWQLGRKFVTGVVVFSPLREHNFSCYHNYVLLTQNTFFLMMVVFMFSLLVFFLLIFSMLVFTLKRTELRK